MTQDQIQEELIQKGLNFFKTEKQGFFNVSVRIGKCRITTEILKTLKKERFVLIAYPDNKLEQTWKDELEKWKYYDTTDFPPFFVNFSSLKKFKNAKLDAFIIDEHHSASPAERDLCHQIMTNSKDCITIALSGTVSKETKEEWGLKEIASYTTEEGISAGILSDYSITVHVVNLDNIIKTPNRRGKLLTEKQKYSALSWVIDNKRQKGESTMLLALARNRLSLSSIGKINYTKNLLKQLKGRTVVFTGLTDVADRLEIPSYHNKSASDKNFLDFQDGKINQLALAQMAKMGVTFINLNSVVLLNFTHNEEETKQQLTRTLKLDYKGKIADLHVICLQENPELLKIKQSLSMLDSSKIKYV